MTHCIHCGAELPATAAFCPGCGKSVGGESGVQQAEAQKTSDVPALPSPRLIAILVAVALVGAAFLVYVDGPKSDREQCISSSEGAHTGVVEAVRERLRDPSSFEHIVSRITAPDGSGLRTVAMEFRSRNGFGGMSVARAVARVRDGTCAAELISISEAR